MKLYLSGGITGVPNHREAFDSARDALTALGHEVISPVDLGDVGDDTFEDYLKRDIQILVNEDVEGIVQLPGWVMSRGAVGEYIVARLIGLEVFSWYNGELLKVEKLGVAGEPIFLYVAQTLRTVV